MTEGARPSMFETVKSHEEKINNHEERIIELEKIDKKHEERLQKLEEQSLKLENTVLSESKETRTVLREQTGKLFTLVESAMGFQSAKSAQNHELKMLKWNTLSTVFLKISGGCLALLSSGGALYYVIQHFLK